MNQIKLYCYEQH